jgi:hypothetical protein
MLPSSDAGQQAELLDRLGLGVKLLSGEQVVFTVCNPLLLCMQQTSNTCRQSTVNP